MAQEQGWRQLQKNKKMMLAWQTDHRSRAAQIETAPELQPRPGDKHERKNRYTGLTHG
jgi:hypothetical protein